MIRRLRWKIVGISMLFVTLVLAAVFPLLEELCQKIWGLAA